jgi:DNA-binding SARP family transcriptional activator
LFAILKLIVPGTTLPEELASMDGAGETPPPKRREIPGLLRRVQDLLGLSPDSALEEALVDDPPPSPKPQAAVLAPQPVVETLPHAGEDVLLAPGGSSSGTASGESHPGSKARDVGPSLTIYCLDGFRVYQDDKLVTGWNGQKSQSILKYLVAHRSRPTAKDILMDVFWPDADSESARNNLNVALYSVRQVFRALEPNFSYILFRDDSYFLNPAMEMWLDVEEFVQRCEAGQQFERQGELEEAMREYGIAESLYQRDFLEDDLYEEWIIPRREALKDCYLVILDRLSRHYLLEGKYSPCIRLCQSILAKDDCRESAHRRLMQCYSRQGQRNLALRQYQLCVETLARVLDVSPTEETVALYREIRNRTAV